MEEISAQVDAHQQNGQLSDPQQPAPELHPKSDSHDVAMEDVKPISEQACAADTAKSAESCDLAVHGAGNGETNGASEHASPLKGTIGEQTAGSAPPKKPATPKVKADYAPGDVVTIKLKGYPPWPGLVVTDDFVPEKVLAQKPKGPKPKKKDDAGEEARPLAPNAWPVLFFADNNYLWATRADLKHLDQETVHKWLDGAGAKKSKQGALRAAYELAASPPSLEEAKHMEPYVEEIPEVEDEEDEPQKKIKKRKKAVESDEDAEIDNQPSSKKSRSRRKSSMGGFTAINGEDDRPTPSRRKSAGTGGRKIEKRKDPSQEAEDLKEKRKKDLLYLRHRLQKAFLIRDKAPSEEEMDAMNEIMKKLEEFTSLDAELIKFTKINKVMKGMIKLESIPKDEEYKFTQRAQTLLDKWAPLLGSVDEKTDAEGTGEKQLESVSANEIKPEVAAVSVPVTEAEENTVSAAESTNLEKEATNAGAPTEGDEAPSGSIVTEQAPGEVSMTS